MTKEKREEKKNDQIDIQVQLTLEWNGEKQENGSIVTQDANATVIVAERWTFLDTQQKKNSIRKIEFRFDWLLRLQHRTHYVHDASNIELLNSNKKQN